MNLDCEFRFVYFANTISIFNLFNILEINMPTFDQILRCEICNDLLYQPMTLICQHTFCYHCLSIGKSTNSMKECPLCRLKLELPPNMPKMGQYILS